MANPQLHIPREELEEFCRRWKVAELALFGSALREDFRVDSDVDVLITFEPEAKWSLFALVKMEHELEEIFNRDVDLVLRTAVEQSENYIRRESILSNLEVLHAPR
ncbi:MAG: nucleotidyltransferase family protein [Anaerolineae bacterium]